MSAEVRSSPQGHYVIDLSCGIEQHFPDRTSAFLTADAHNETHHARRSERHP